MIWGGVVSCKALIRDMIDDSIFPSIFWFQSLFDGNFFQQLYNTGGFPMW